MALIVSGSCELAVRLFVFYEPTLCNSRSFAIVYPVGSPSFREPFKIRVCALFNAVVSDAKSLMRPL